MTTASLSTWARYQAPYAAFAYAYFPITLTKRVLLHPKRASSDLMVRRFWDRWGWLPAGLGDGPGSPLWMHMNSGGEVVMAQSLLKRLEAAGHRPVCSSDSYDAQGLLRQWFGPSRVFFPPWDTRLPAQRTLARVRPNAMVFMMNAYFPVLLAQAKRRGVRTVLVNGVLSRNVDIGNRWLRRALALRVNDTLDAIAVQSEQDFDAYRALGVSADRLTVTGKLEGDLASLRINASERVALRATLGWRSDERVLIVGSVHPGEEPAILEAFKRLRAAVPQARLMVAPRWLHDAATMAGRLAAQGYTVVRRTERLLGTAQTDHQDVLLIDTFGELRTLYAAADAAFIGSSLVPINERKGGHNVLEPLAHRVPPLFGPHMNLWRGVTAELLGAWPGLEVDSAQALASRAAELFTGAAPVEAIRRTGDAIIDRESGALDRTLAFLAKWTGGGS